VIFINTKLIVSMLKTIRLTALLAICFASAPLAQTSDTLKTVQLPEFIFKANKPFSTIGQMPDLKDNTIYAGKKTEVIRMDGLHADLSTNNTRQVFAKVPGITIWENDGSGIQVGIAARGLSPNRSWEFNVRQNGYDISSEVFGYPESYYAPPMEALEKIEVIRGAASLQFGPQFGGLLNYQLKKGNPNKPVSLEMIQTMGSYGLFNSYTGIGGTVKKFSYYGFLHHRSADGWRNNSRYSTTTGYISLRYEITSKISLSAEFTRMGYHSQQPGGLTDDMYRQNHRQSLRERNWFSAPANLASVTLNYEITPKIGIQVKSFLNLSERNSVGFTKAMTIADTINQKTLQYDPRQVDRDSYHNYGTEARMSVKYTLFGQENTFAGGIRAYKGNTERRQLGSGTTGTGPDFGLTNPIYGRSLSFSTTNLAAFAEHIFQLGSRLKVVPGIRIDHIQNTSKGYINTTDAGKIQPADKARTVVLFGVGGEFAASEKTMVYANFSTAYRPVTFSEITPSATTEIVDPNLKDASGFNADLGYRGKVKNFLSFDAGLFYLNYNNRIGTVSRDGGLYKTNIGASVSQGIESFVELDLVKMITHKTTFGSLTVFFSNALIDATYTRWDNPAIADDATRSVKNKRVENAPQYINRFGATYNLHGFSATCQASFVGDVFTDASNTVTPNAASTTGKLAGYEVIDASLAYKYQDRYHCRLGINNLADEKYATRRAGGYPGPGILPGNGRNFFLTVGATF